MPFSFSVPLQNSLQAHAGPVQAPHWAAGAFNDTWNWASSVALVACICATVFSVIALRKRRRDKEANELKPFHDLLADTLVLLDKLEATAVTPADVSDLGATRSRIKQAERRWPKISFGEVIAHIKVYEKTALPEDFARVLIEKDTLNDLLRLSREQGASITALRTAIEVVQREIERRSSR
ncbi:hypothetical protein ACFYM0_33750 [Streptomyces sp. NPDC006487]|uniref:hypothetical protein n=1 Tax=Streptomyces sp. NPDC006487 TaxID=3364748 RepID=UPI0036754439